MMELRFFKYHGTGNDFLIIDNRSGTVALSSQEIAWLCDRHFGVGGDGLMLLERHPDYDFRMVYYNADGGQSTMCGNGGRCMVAFARRLGIIGNRARFVAIDGPHEAALHDDGMVSLHMKDVPGIRKEGADFLLDTGSPHYVRWVKGVDALDVKGQGRAIRTLPGFMPEGINVNFVERVEGAIRVRTYERGVEDETLSCGTGVTAAAIASVASDTGSFRIPVVTPGGMLEVSFEKVSADSAQQVVLKGPAEFVFEGLVDISKKEF